LPNWALAKAGSCSKNNAYRRTHIIAPQEGVHL
jgi:hypothetical protein